MNKQQIYKISIILALTIFIMSPVFVSAAPGAGIKPGSFFYFFDTSFEKINLFFTFNPEKKAQKNLEYADERLAEAEAVANEKNTDAVKTAVAGYESNIASATEESKQIKDKGKTEELLNSIADNTSKHQEVLADVYNKVPDEAKKAIEKAIEVSTKNHENALKEIEGLKKTVEELQKDIESLKQKGQSDQSKEIEAMRKEIEALKSQKSSQSAQPKIIEKVVEKIVEVPPATSQKPATKLSNSEIIEKVKPAVVYIQTSDGSGSGMIIESNGYVLTNAHVVSGVNTAKIKLSDGRLFIGSVIGRDEKIDLTLLKINGENFPTVILGDSSVDALKQGDEVFAFGYPFGLEGDVSFKEGTISRRQIYEGTTYLETSAQIHPGNSGGPLVNRYAQVIGVNTQSVGTGVSGVLVGETIKFALPINLARGLIPDLKSGRNVVLSKITLPSLPTPSPTPTPQPLPTPVPSCTKDIWSCSDWSECSSGFIGFQTRTCNITFDCSVANTPSPNTTQSCTPPPPPPPQEPKAINISSIEIAITYATLKWNVDPGYQGSQLVNLWNKFRIGCGEDYSYSIWPIGSSQGSFLGFSAYNVDYRGTISNLNPNTTYHCRVEIYNKSSGKFISGSDNYTFTTSAATPPQPTPDTTAPVITLTGDMTVNLTVGDSYTDAGATALDNIDSDITSNIVTINPIDTNVAGTYTITYNVSDAALNPAIKVTRTVNVSAVVIPPTPPPSSLSE